MAASMYSDYVVQPLPLSPINVDTILNSIYSDLHTEYILESDPQQTRKLVENFLSFSNPQPYLDLVNSFHQRHLIHKREVLVVPNTWMSILVPQNVKVSFPVILLLPLVVPEVRSAARRRGDVNGAVCHSNRREVYHARSPGIVQILRPRFSPETQSEHCMQEATSGLLRTVEGKRHPARNDQRNDTIVRIFRFASGS